MAQLNPDSPFQLWILSEQEQALGSILTASQKQVIQNHIAYAAIQKMNLEFDPANPMVFMQNEALYKGQMQALEALLDASRNAEAKFDPGLIQRNISTQVDPTQE